jgi:hypothetical protein
MLSGSPGRPSFTWITVPNSVVPKICLIRFGATVSCTSRSNDASMGSPPMVTVSTRRNVLESWVAMAAFRQNDGVAAATVSVAASEGGEARSAGRTNSTTAARPSAWQVAVTAAKLCGA